MPYITLYSFFVTDGTSVAIPTSTGKRSTFASSAMMQTLVSPLVKLSATIAVTSCPVCVTPSSTTPLSAHIMISPRFRSSKSEVPLIPAIWITASSRLPRLNSGFPTVIQCARASSIAFSSSGFIFSFHLVSFIWKSNLLSFRFVFVSFLLASVGSTRFYKAFGHFGVGIKV